MNAKRIGDVQVVKNTRKHRLAAAEYNFIRLQLPDGKEVKLLLTDNEVARAKLRAEKNPEDLPKVTSLRNLFD